MYDFYTTSAELLKETTDEAAFTRNSNGGFTCASCDKDIKNLYNLLNKSQDRANWNKLPPRESPGKVFF